MAFFYKILYDIVISKIPADFLQLRKCTKYKFKMLSIGGFKMASLSLKHINKTYPNGFVAVKDFNLEIADKEFIIFVGPSGCGKSTTLRMIAGLEEISGGELYIGDKLMNDIEPKDRDIAMVFQNYALYPHICYTRGYLIVTVDQGNIGASRRRHKRAAVSFKRWEIIGVVELYRCDDLMCRTKA